MTPEEKKSKAPRRQADEAVRGGMGLIYTVGHSTQSFAQLAEILRRHEIARLVDVRSYPSSRRMPHFGKEALEQALPREGIRYVHLRDLGGRRKPHRDSRNLGWRVEGFRGYADYMRTERFLTALEELEDIARRWPSAIMCAEALWWGCHRRLISDALVVRGWRVLHVGRGEQVEEHALTPFALVENGVITYPATQSSLEL